MRLALFIAVAVVLLIAAAFAVPAAPAAGQTVPPPTPTACPDDCGPIPTPRPIAGTPAPGCPEGFCLPFPTPRPTDNPNDDVSPAIPDPGKTLWHYVFMPVAGR